MTHNTKDIIIIHLLTRIAIAHHIDIIGCIISLTVLNFTSIVYGHEPKCRHRDGEACTSNSIRDERKAMLTLGWIMTSLYFIQILRIK